ncbi:thioredoxin domain-containing protein [Orbus wheelerorum]|uniref:DsbA family protein n=1 Tax=Orbus wheelerorum TaxID=3074111 RepID=UPI00370D694B
MALKPPVTNLDHIQGNSNASIELVEYGDYQCPYCAEFYYVIKELQNQLGTNLKFIFRNFPLEMHPNALHAAIATEVLAKYNKFWPMHDMLYENQAYLHDKNLINYAEKLGVNEQQFEQDFKDKSFADKVEKDFESGLRSGVNGTPSLYINNKKYEGEYSLDAILTYIKPLL